MKPLASVTVWKADREAIKRDVLAFLGIEHKSIDELLLIYEAASTAFEAWAPPMIDGAEELNSPWTRESERAFIAMEAVAERLAVAPPQGHMATRHHLIAALADWQAHCNDNPDIHAAILRLIAEDKEDVERLRGLRTSH